MYIFYCEYFQYREALKSCGIVITSRTVHGYIHATANMIRKKISAELKDEMFSILADIATKHTRSVLGVNTACVINDEIVIRTISMEQITHKHSSDNLVNDLIHLLEEKYSLKSTQVYSFLADNAYNMYKTGTLLNEAASNEDAIGEPAESAHDEDEPRMISEAEYDDVVLNMFHDCQFYSDLIANVATKYAARNKDIHIKSTNTIGCASHTLHLIVEKGIATTQSAKRLISLARELVKKLRTTTILDRIRVETSYKLPQIDVPTRWNSKFIMVINQSFQR